METKLLKMAMLAFALALMSCSKDEPKLSESVIKLSETTDANGSRSSYSDEPGEAVDLGLSVKWSSKNLGAENPKDAGRIMAWGDPTGEERNMDGIEFRSTHYATYHLNEVTWYSDLYGGIDPPHDIAGTELDAAHVMWGGKWRMPTVKEAYELITKCQWKAHNENGRWTFEAIGPNGNSIIFPTTPLERLDINQYYDPDSCNMTDASYWTSTSLNQYEQDNRVQMDLDHAYEKGWLKHKVIYKTNTRMAWTLGMGYAEWYNPGNRYNHHPIRPVQGL